MKLTFILGKNSSARRVVIPPIMLVTHPLAVIFPCCLMRVTVELEMNTDLCGSACMEG